jgi:uncharacterized membrane protein
VATKGRHSIDKKEIVMNIFFTIAGIAVIVVALLLLLSGFFGKKGAKSVAEGDVEPQKAVLYVIGGFVIALLVVVLYRQVLAAVGQGSEAGDPHIFEWVRWLVKQATDGSLPMLK